MNDESADAAAKPDDAGMMAAPHAPPKFALPSWAPMFLGAVFALQILVIIAAGVTGMRYGQDISAARREAALSARRAQAYAAYAECLAGAASQTEDAERAAAADACVKPE